MTIKAIGGVAASRVPAIMWTAPLASTSVVQKSLDSHDNKRKQLVRCKKQRATIALSFLVIQSRPQGATFNIFEFRGSEISFPGHGKSIVGLT